MEGVPDRVITEPLDQLEKEMNLWIIERKPSLLPSQRGL